MSNLHYLEPQAQGLVSIKTNFGDIDVELFTKQCPKNTRNFVQLCLDGFYNGTIFERVEKDFIAVGGVRVDEEDHEEEEFPDEFHSRLRFTRRGLLATANTAKNSNGSKFFFTLGATPELQNKNTIFGRVVGNSIYTLVNLNECPVDEDSKPFSDKSIECVTVKENPFPDLVQRKSYLTQTDEKEKDSDDEYDPLLKPKPSKLSAQKLSFYSDSEDSDESDRGDKDLKEYGNLHKTQSKEPQDLTRSPSAEQQDPTSYQMISKTDTGKDSLQDEPGEEEEVSEKERRLREIRSQIASIKQQIESESTTTGSRKRADNSSGDDSTERKRPLPVAPDTQSHDIILNLAPKKSKNRERETIERVEGFKKRLKQVSATIEGSFETSPKTKQPIHDSIEDELDALDKVDSDDWLRHKFEAADEVVLAKDANLRGKEWYSIDDPRNSLNYISRESSRSNRRPEHDPDRSRGSSRRSR